MISKNSTGIVIRPMEIDDLKKVLEIEKQSFPVPWTYDLFFSELTRNRYARYFVLGKDNEVVGYLGLWHKGSSFHITNIAITEKLRRKGYGRKLLKFVEKIAVTHKIKKISLEVGSSNRIAQDMYKKYGYKVIRILRNYYQEEKEDALIMEKKL
ncbi:MAG: ribosomal protein S18-alanine N-acetyltransferase [Candidatus Caldatribacteriota bacterium]|nr:ribosomal protein S18-alanine N-acetyltransferase [Candidatus Caldatribacteriota bacterium]